MVLKLPISFSSSAHSIIDAVRTSGYSLIIFCHRIHFAPCLSILLVSVRICAAKYNLVATVLYLLIPEIYMISSCVHSLAMFAYQHLAYTLIMCILH